jgi:hypothetical protein
MPVTLDPNAPEHAQVRADLGRLFIVHKADMGLGAWPDAEIIARTNEIAATLMTLGRHALEHGDAAWLARHAWFSKACELLFDGYRSVPLDG